MLPSEEMRKRGMAKHELKNGRGEVCARGAVMCHLDMLPDGVCQVSSTPESRAWDDELARAAGATHRFGGIAGWNNDAKRTMEDVVAILEQVERARGLWPRMDEVIAPFKEVAHATK